MEGTCRQLRKLQLLSEITEEDAGADLPRAGKRQLLPIPRPGERKYFIRPKMRQLFGWTSRKWLTDEIGDSVGCFHILERLSIGAPGQPDLQRCCRGALEKFRRRPPFKRDDCDHVT